MIGQVGVYPVGVLSLSFYERLGADALIGRKSSKTSAWVRARGLIRIDGLDRDVRSRWRLGLADAPSSLPEVILVAPNADQLGQFLDELLEFFRALELSGRPSLDRVPKFLLASSGLYFSDVLKEALRRVETGPLIDKPFFLRAVRRRLFRAVAYQAGIRKGRGSDADYLTGKGASHLILSRTGTEEDRARICGIIGGRGYDIRVEDRTLEAEYDKALVNLIFSAFTQLYAVSGGRLLDVRFGDLFPGHAALPADFIPQPLRESPGSIQERIEVLGRAFVSVAVAQGAYAPGTVFKERFGALCREVLEKFPRHVPSSFQIFRERLSDRVTDWKGDALLPTERAVIEPLLRSALELGDVESARVLRGFECDLLAAYQRAIDLSDCHCLARRLAQLKSRKASGALLVGIHGLPGSGKTTLSLRLSEVLRAMTGEQVVALSIDDFYYSREELRRRGIRRWGPGAHNLALAGKLTELERSGPGSTVELPVFDKALRDRSPATRIVSGEVGFVLFEGFGVGLRSGGYDAFSEPLDYLISLKADADSCKKWRREAGWRDRREFHQGDWRAFSADFEGLWALISELDEWVTPEVEVKADLVLPVGEGHRLGPEIDLCQQRLRPT